MEKESPRRKRRRAKLALLLAEVGGVSRAAELTGTPKSHFSAMLTGRRGVGDALAEKLEQCFDKEPGWFDDEAAGYWPFSEELQYAVMQIGADGLERMENVLRAALGLAPPLKVLQNQSEKHQVGENATAESHAQVHTDTTSSSGSRGLSVVKRAEKWAGKSVFDQPPPPPQKQTGTHGRSKTSRGSPRK